MARSVASLPGFSACSEQNLRRNAPFRFFVVAEAEPQELPLGRATALLASLTLSLSRCVRKRVTRLCSALLSDFAWRLGPSGFAITSPLSGCEEDFHLRAVKHARRTNKKGTHACPLRTNRSSLSSHSRLEISPAVRKNRALFQLSRPRPSSAEPYAPALFEKLDTAAASVSYTSNTVSSLVICRTSWNLVPRWHNRSDAPCDFAL
jgi:hypothetical protein